MKKFMNRSQIATSKTPEDEAVALLRSQFATAKDLSKIRTLPYAFTRNGSPSRGDRHLSHRGVEVPDPSVPRKGKADVFANAIKHDHKSQNPTTRWSDIIKLK